MTTLQLFNLTLAVLPIICSLSVAFCRFLLENLPSKQQRLLRQLVSEVVDAAEQIGPTDKKTYAANLILAEAKRLGIPATSSQIDYLIETFVFNLKAEIMSANTVQLPIVKALPKA